MLAHNADEDVDVHEQLKELSKKYEQTLAKLESLVGAAVYVPRERHIAPFRVIL